MPYPNEHACRLRDPGDFQADSFRRTSREGDGKRYDVIMGRLTGESEMTEQAYRYPRDSWGADDARAHCEAHDGISFEPATGESALGLEIERRTVTLREITIGDETEGPPTIRGYAAVFGALSEELGGFREVIEPGFFEGAVGGDVRALWNHDPNWVLGRTKSGTLALQEDAAGLAFIIQPPPARWAEDAMISIRRGDVDQASFGFTVRKGGDAWQTNADGVMVRTLLKGGCAQLFDISPVTFPAYPQTSAQVRARLHELEATASQEDTVEPQPDPARMRLERMRRELQICELEV